MMMVYFLKGKLPWQNFKFQTTQDYFDYLRQIKNDLTPEDLCSDLPSEFLTIFKYCRELDFEETPDYHLLRFQLKQLMQ